MATVNRYTNVRSARYNPRSMQEMMMLPMMRRQQHDASVAKATEMGLFKQQAAGVDEETVNRVKGEYEGSINDYVDRLNREGFNHETTQGLIDLAKNRKELEEKYLNPAHSNLVAMQEYKKQLMESKDWSPAMAQAFAAGELGNFKGTFNEDGSTNSFQGKMLPKYVDANKRLDEAIKMIGDDSIQGELEKYGVHNMHDLMKSTKIEGKTKEKILSAVGMQLQGDNEFLNSYRVESKLNGLDEFDSDGRLKIGQFSEDGTFVPESRLGLSLYGKAIGAAEHKQTLTLKELKDDMRLHKAKKQIDEEVSNPAMPHSYLPAERHTIATESFRDKLLNPGKNSKAHINTSGFYSWGQTGITTAPIDEREFSQDEQERYETLFTTLKKTDPSFANLDMNSDEAKKAVGAHLSKYQDFAYSNPLIRPSQLEGNSIEGALPYTSDVKQAATQIAIDVKNGLASMWDAKGNKIDPKKVDWDETQVEYLGVVGPNNHLDNFKDANPDEMVMPHMIGIGGEQFYVSKVGSTKQTPEFEATKAIKLATYQGARLPGLPVQQVVNSPIVGQLGVTSVYHPDTDSYDIQVADPKGTYTSEPYKNVSPEIFNEIMHSIFKKKE